MWSSVKDCGVPSIAQDCVPPLEYVSYIQPVCWLSKTVVYTPVMNPHLTHLFYRTMVSKCSVETSRNSITWEPVTNANSDSTADLLYQKFLEVGPSKLRITEPLGWFLCTLKCDHTCGLLPNILRLGSKPQRCWCNSWFEIQPYAWFVYF